MAAVRFLNLIAISTLAILATSFSATPVNALATDSHAIRDVSYGHAALARRKRDSSTNVKRCKARPSSSSAKATAKPTSSSSSKSGSGKSSSSSSSSSKSSTKSSSSAKSSSTASSSSGSSGYTGSKKVGLAWPNGDDPSLKNFKTDHVSPIYTWSPDFPSNAKSLGFYPIPMLWGDNQVDHFKSVVKQGYANMVFGFNEPNESGQSNMTPEHGADLWKKYIEPLKNEGYSLISPATSSNPNGKTWVSNFLKACNGGCTFNGIAVHYYDVTPEGFIKYMEDWHDTYKLPVYPTEFACQNFNNGPQCSKDQVYNFMETAVAYMEKADWIPMYFAFGVMKDMQGVNTLNQLMDSSGKPTALGSMYINGQ